MVNCNRIKEYIFPQTSVASSDYVATGSILTLYSHAINGEILKIQTLCNYAGSLILLQSGARAIDAYSHTAIASGTGLLSSVSFSNTTGSYVVNDVLKLMVSGTASGTGVVIGPVSVFYR